MQYLILIPVPAQQVRVSWTC